MRPVREHKIALRLNEEEMEALAEYQHAHKHRTPQAAIRGLIEALRTHGADVSPED